MGDHRADIKLKMEIHGREYKHEMWINYSPNEDGIDDRIVGWFRDCWNEAYSLYQERENKAMSQQKKEETEEQERAELKRLKKKYECVA